MRAKKVLLVVLLCSIIATTFTGCFAGFENDIKKKGGLFGSHKADYIVINYSGNKIVDVYKLRDIYVKSEEGSDGVNFVDANDNPVIIQGDLKIIRCNNASEWDKYTEYHLEFNLVEYQEFVKNK